MYKWNKPKRESQKSVKNEYEWFYGDFMTETFQWSDGLNRNTMKQKPSSTPNGYNMYYNNQNLKENWNLLSSHFVHITGSYAVRRLVASNDLIY